MDKSRSFVGYRARPAFRTVDFSTVAAACGASDFAEIADSLMFAVASNWHAFCIACCVKMPGCIRRGNQEIL